MLTDGLRKQKTVNGVTSTYYYQNGQLNFQNNGTDAIWYFYGNGGKLNAMRINGTYYYYYYNAQGDVLGLINTSGDIYCQYTYDSWGKLISIKDASNVDKTNDPTFNGTKNPFRYRGYYYDTETGMYYLQSRYYMPEWGRFLNADKVDVLSQEQILPGDVNLFAYCMNNPTTNADPTGRWIARAIITAASTLIFGGIAYLIGRAIGMRGSTLAVFTAAFAAVGLVLGLWKGVAVLKQINALIKPVIYFFSNPGKVYFGLKLLSLIQFEIHAPHHNKPIHFVVRLFLSAGQKAWEWWLGK